MKIRSIAVFALPLALIATLALPAYAGIRAARSVEGASVPAAEYHQRLEAKLARKQAKMERHIANRRLSAPEAAAVRSQHQLKMVHIHEAAQIAERDGVVTKDEMRAIHAAGSDGQKVKSKKHKKHHAASHPEAIQNLR